VSGIKTPRYFADGDALVEYRDYLRSLLEGGVLTYPRFHNRMVRACKRYKADALARERRATLKEFHAAEPQNRSKMNYNEEKTEQAVSGGVVLTHDADVTSATPLNAKPAAYEVGQSDPGQPAAPTVGMETSTAGAPRVPEVGGESAFGMNAQPEKNTGLVQAYKQPASGLPDSISARQIYNDRSNPDGCSDSERQR
jgi:hypothetical protein